MTKSRLVTLLLGMLLSLIASTGVWAQQMLPVPELTARVIDQTGTLTQAARTAMEARLSAFERSNGSQIVVLMVPTTAPEDMAAYAHRVADTWKIGRRDMGDGLLLVIAKDDRRMRIEVAKTLEGAIPDLAAARIIDTVLKPAFRTGDFAGGIDRAIDQLTARIEGEPLPIPASEGDAASSQDSMPLIESLLFFFFVPVFFFTRMLRKVLGSILAAPATSLIAGAVVWLIFGGLLYPLLAGMAAFVVSLFALAFKPGSTGMGGNTGGYYGGGYYGDSHGSSSSSSGSDWGGGFTSGGGGDFGGGGASGDW